MLLADTLIVIGTTIASLGTIQEADGPRQQSFWLRNAGIDSVCIVQGYTSCGCTTIAFPSGEMIAPGDSVSVTLRFNPQGKGGEFEETGTLVYASRPSAPQAARKRLRVSLTGECITSEETLLRQFPIRVSDRLRLSTDRFDLGIISHGQKLERSVVVLHRGDNLQQAGRQECLVISFVPDATIAKGRHRHPYSLKTMDDGREVTLTIMLDFIIH